MRRNRQIVRVMLFMLCALALVLSGNQAIAQTGTWATKAPMPTARGEPAAAEINGTLYAVGGEVRNDCTFIRTLEAYSPMTNTWATKTAMSIARTTLAAGVINGILYAVGGSVGCGPRTGAVEAYDPATDTWTRKASMPTARAHLAVGVVNGILYAVGGIDSSGRPLSTVEAYDPATDRWMTKAPMPTARYGLAAGVVGGVLYVVGGGNACGGPTGNCATLEAYDPATDTWTPKASMPTARVFLAGGVVNGVFYAVGGSDIGVLSTVEAYNPVTNTWTTAAPMPTARAGSLAVGVANATLYAVGGRPAGPCCAYLATNEAFNPAIQVQIDIKPSRFPNAIPDTDTINLTAQGTLPVAIFTTSDFNAADVNPGTVVFAGAPTVRSAQEDVDGDGDLDLMLHFDNQTLNLACADTQAALHGQTASGTSIHGTDSIRVLKDKNGNKCP